MMNLSPPLSIQVELSFRCKKLADLDIRSKSDPMVIMFVEDKSNSGGWKEFGRTEMIKNNLNPKFVNKIIMPYRFETIQMLKFIVVDYDNGEIKEKNIIGVTLCKLSDILTMPKCKLKLELNYPIKNGGYLIINAEEVKNIDYSVKMQFKGKDLQKKDLFGKSDPYLVISRENNNGEFTPVVKTHHILKTLKPKWDPILQSAQSLCNGDLTKPLRIECFDWNKTAKHELIGRFETTLDELIRSEGKSFELRRKKKDKTYGTIWVKQCQMIKEHTFLDYISGGCEMKLMVAIDFTASNREHTKPNSLHNIDDPINKPNDYIRATRLVGDILCAYDSTKRIPAFGFGAKLPDGTVSHSFYMSGNPNNPEVDGIDGVIDAYIKTLNHVSLSAPTNFEDVIRLSTTIAKNRSANGLLQSYCILLIITDGVISDMKQTVDAIADAAEWPLSIIIVGVGDADFSQMEFLDGDENPLISKYGEKIRDIVQFVPFNKHTHDLPMVVLEELPKQVVSYFKSKNIQPNPPGHGIHQSYVQMQVDPSMMNTTILPPPMQ